jgi:hypothetical protein
MSADNFYLIRKDNFGLFAPVMGFASDEQPPTITSRHPRFTTVEAALDAISGEWSEYGTSVHPECLTDEPAVLETQNGHYLDCPQSDPDIALYYPEDDNTCRCADVLRQWNTLIPPHDELTKA